MAQRLVVIRYKYSYIDQPSGTYEDVVYMRENQFMDYDNNEVCEKIVNMFLNEIDKSKVLKSITEINRLGFRLI